jgi:peptide chain release factor
VSWLLITAGRGPAECALAVLRTVEQLKFDAARQGIALKILDVQPGEEPGTAESVLIALEGASREFVESWTGSIQWSFRSPFRPTHKRKNWFVGVTGIRTPETQAFDAREVRYETMRAGGPGGQHVNRTESAVRAIHQPTGLVAVASEERSQHRNRALALARLASKIEESNEKRKSEANRARREQHDALERGNPIRSF